MNIRELSTAGFRNLKPGKFSPCTGVNLLCGENGQGKTNLIEACWLFTGARSFRGARDAEMVAFGEEEAALRLSFFAAGREQEAQIRIRGRRSATLNGVPQPSAAKLAGRLCGVVFSPAHLSLIREGPEGRRRFIDAAYYQIRPGYVATMAEFKKVLAQRTAFLRQTAERAMSTADIAAQLPLWDHALAAAGARITAARLRYVRRLRPLAAEIYAGLSAGRETLSLSLLSDGLPPEMSASGADDLPDAPIDAVAIAARWESVLQSSTRADLATGTCTAGPHREELEVLLDGKHARTFGSQGQQRSAVLALKLAEAQLLEQTIGEPPMVFLDDVMSELDLGRQDHILNHIEGRQVFITCCEPSTPLRMTAGRVFSVTQGEITGSGCGG